MFPFVSVEGKEDLSSVRLESYLLVYHS